MKKIVFNTDSLILGGAEKIALEYIKVLSEKNQVTLLVNENNGKKNLLLDEIPREVKVEFVIDKGIIEKLNILRDLKNKNFLYKIPYNYYLKKRRKSFEKNIGEKLKKYEYDYLFDFYCKIPSKYIDKRTISFLHSSLIGMKNKDKEKFNRKFKKVGKIIVITDDLKREFEEKFVDLKDKVKRIYNFFDLDFIREKGDESCCLLENEKELIKEKYILACSRLDKKKDIETLIESYNLIRNKIDEKLYIVGDGPNKINLENLVKKLDLQKEIIFLGNQKNPYIWMKNSKIFVHSSKQEGFGMVIVEALAFGKTVIASDCPVGPREILEDGKRGLLFPVGDYLLLSKLIEKELKIKDRYKDLAMERAKDFSKEKVKIEIEKLLK